MQNNASNNQTGTSMPVCVICGSSLSPDEIALTKKLINRGATEFLCLSCLAHKFDVSPDTLREKIAQFREMGCTLFFSSGS